MRAITTSAPGKIVISGEYAVLDGAPAIAAAVTPRARVTIRDAEGPDHVVTANGDQSTRTKFRIVPDDIEWLSGGEGFGIVESVWRVVCSSPSVPLAIDIDTTEFFAATSNTKLGLGSSAAATTALTAALLATSDSTDSVLEAALDAHRQFQQGVGSGIDVACSASGGLIRYRVIDAEPIALTWPTDLEYAVFWSGVAASTTQRLESLSQQAPKQSRVLLDAAATQAAAAWEAGLSADILAAMRAYTETLQQFSVDHDLGIFDAGHAELAEAANDGVLYKPCGAGGGDVGLALATSKDALADFTTRAVAAGFVAMDVSIEPDGYQVSKRDE